MNEAKRGGRPAEGEKTRIELRLDSQLAEEAEREAKQRGFSSLQQWLSILVTREVRGVGDRPLSFLGLGNRLQNALLDSGRVDTVADLTKLSARDILRMKNLGTQTLGEVREALAKHGLSLRGG